jgi:pimeloyl-ACP methyl ester carboxylesterase
MEQFAAMMPDARVEVIPGAGHAAPAERPAEIADLIGRFLAVVEGNVVPE